MPCPSSHTIYYAMPARPYHTIYHAIPARPCHIPRYARQAIPYTMVCPPDYTYSIPWSTRPYHMRCSPSLTINHAMPTMPYRIPCHARQAMPYTMPCPPGHTIYHVMHCQAMSYTMLCLVRPYPIPCHARQAIPCTMPCIVRQGLTNVLPGRLGQVSNPAGQVHFPGRLPSRTSEHFLPIVIFQVFMVVGSLVIYYQRDKYWPPTDCQ